MKKSICLLLIVLMVFSSLPFTMVYAAETPLFTESFEEDLSQWTNWSKKATEENNRLTDEGYTDGKQSFFLNDPSTDESYGIQSDEIPVTPGETYTVHYDAFSISGALPCYFRFFDADGNTLDTVSKKVSPSTKWTTVKLTKVAPVGAVCVRVLFVTVKADKTSGYYDNVRVYKGDIPTTKIPSSKIPPIPEKEEIEIFPDNYEDGEEILSESFESGIPSEWTTTGALPLEPSTEVASDGKTSIYIGDDSDSASVGLKTPFIEVAQGNTYTAIIDVYATRKTIPSYLRFYDENKTELQNAKIAMGEIEKWTTYTNAQIAPEGAKYMQLWIYTVKASISCGFIDNVKLVKGNYVPEKPEVLYIAPKQVAPVDAKLVTPDGDKLLYSEYNELGDKIGDFSYAGFYMGEYELPDSKKIPVALELSPTGTEDDTNMLQEAIDKVYNEAPDDSLKIIKLKSGTYYINKGGIALKSGIVLSGEGQGPTGTILYAKDPVQYVPVKISGSAPAKTGDSINITDDYIKAGTKTINVSASDATKLKVGDLITICTPSTDALSKAIGMDNIINLYEDNTSWRAGDFDVASERIIEAINGTEITLNHSLLLPANKEYTQSYLYKTDESNKVQNAGVENLRIVSYYNGDPFDENHATKAIVISNAKNIFIRDITTKYFYFGAVQANMGTKQVTVSNASCLDPVSTVAGDRRYSFHAFHSSQQILFTGCYSFDARHDFAASQEVTGPIVFVDNVADSSNTSAETHATWSTGVLFDNLYQIGNGSKGFFAMGNRGRFGTSLAQGWTAASSIMWNCLSSTLLAHDVPGTYENFLIGTWGIYTDEASLKMKENNISVYMKNYRKTGQTGGVDSNFATKDGTPMVGDAYKEAEFTPVEPRSLYKAQLAERITGSIKNARPNAPVIVYPKSDKVTKVNEVKISGLYQLGAEKVTLYIDDKAYDAKLNTETNEFEYTITLDEGVHKIYATQTIGGVEGVKNADRFITIGKEKENPPYLQSIYPASKTTLLVNDPRVTYDVYDKKTKEIEASKITVKVDNLKLESDVEPFIENGRTLVPMRAIFEAIGAEVEWDAATETATSKKDGKEVKITKDNVTAYVNGTPYTLDVPAMIKDGRFVVPVRFISESFDCEVEWNGIKKLVLIMPKIVRFKASHSLPGELDVYGLIQSGDDGAGAIIDNTYDNDFSTGWGIAYNENNPDGAYGIIDLGYEKEISEIKLAFHAGDKRTYTIDIYVGNSKDNMTKVLNNVDSSGTTTDFETYKLGVKGRFVKIVGKGNSLNYWTNIKEIAIIGR